MCKWCGKQGFHFSEWSKKNFKVPCQPSEQCVIPSGRPSVYCQPSGRCVTPSRHQTDKHHLSGWRASSVRTPISYREASVQTCSVQTFQQHVRTPIKSRTDHWFFPKFQEREDQSTVRTMWYPVRTRISVRQESQFKMNRPDIWQLWSGRWCIVYGNCRFDFNRLDVSPSWSGRTRIRYGNCVLKFSRLETPSPWSGRAKLGMEITCRDVRPSGQSNHPIRTMFLYRKDFSTKILENLVAQLSIRTAMIHTPDGSQENFAWRPFWPPAYK